MAIFANEKNKLIMSQVLTNPPPQRIASIIPAIYAAQFKLPTKKLLIEITVLSTP